MPVIGIILAKVDARKLLILGIVICSTTLIQLSHLNLNAGFWDFCWPQFFMGVSLGMLFVPLTTITMDPIKNEAMGNATSLFNLVRNLGGSIGIASVSTIQTRRAQMDINILGAHVNPHNTNAVLMMDSLRHHFMERGADPTMAMRQTLGAMFGMIERQGSMIAYNTTFRILGIMFLGMIPFVLLMKRPKKRGGPAAAH